MSRIQCLIGSFCFAEGNPFITSIRIYELREMWRIPNDGDYKGASPCKKNTRSHFHLNPVHFHYEKTGICNPIAKKNLRRPLVGRIANGGFCVGGDEYNYAVE